MYLNTRRSAGTLELDLTGDWRMGHFTELDRSISAVDLQGVREVLIRTDRLGSLDASAGWLLQGFVNRAQRAGAQVRFPQGEPDLLRLIETQGLAPEEGAARAPGAPAAAAAEKERAYTLATPLTFLGRHSVLSWQDMQEGLAFFGRACVTALGALRNPRRLRPIAIARQVYDTGVTAIPIITLIAFLISVIVAYLGAQELKQYGASILVVDLVTIGVLRELAVLLTAIIVAGRSGSAFAAEIGSMRLNEEVDALYAIGVDPYEVLVLPRVFGLVIALPLLTVIADLVGLTGGAVLCRALLDIPLSQYLVRVKESIASTTFWVGVVKAPVFALLIAFAGTLRGMQVRGSSRELGRLTTVAVVQAIFLVILADAVFAILFMELDI